MSASHEAREAAAVGVMMACVAYVALGAPLALIGAVCFGGGLSQALANAILPVPVMSLATHIARRVFL